MPHKAFNNKNKQFQPKRLWRLLANVFCKRMKYYIYSSQSKRSIPKMNKFSSSAPGYFLQLFCAWYIWSNKTLREQNNFPKKTSKDSRLKKKVSSRFWLFALTVFVERRSKWNSLFCSQISHSKFKRKVRLSRCKITHIFQFYSNILFKISNVLQKWKMPTLANVQSPQSVIALSITDCARKNERLP